MLLTGDPLDADRAERVGLVNRVTGPGGAVDAAVALAARICENGPVAVRETMWFLAEPGRRPTSGRAGSSPRTRRTTIRTADDTREGVAAFFERRPPRWTGR